MRAASSPVLVQARSFQPPSYHKYHAIQQLAVLALARNGIQLVTDYSLQGVCTDYWVSPARPTLGAPAAGW